MSFAINNIFLCGSATNEGRFDFSLDHFTWASRTSDRKIIIPTKSIKEASWYDMGRSCQLWLLAENVKTGNSGASSSSSTTSSADGAQLYRFEGFRSGDYERIAGYVLSNTSTKLSKRELSAKGRNFGAMRLGKGGVLEFVDDEGNLVAPIPLSGVSNAAAPGKDEVVIHCHDDDAVDREDEILLEMKFYVPPGATIGGAPERKSKGKKSQQNKGAGGGGEEEDGAEEDEDGAEEDENGAAKQLHSLIQNVTGISSASGEAIVTLPPEAGTFQVPRARFGIEMYPSYMRMIGPSYEFKVQYKSIARVTYLPLPTSTGDWSQATRYAIVISLDDPLRQGSQRHPHLVMQLDNTEFVAPLHVSAEDKKAGKYEGLGGDGADTVRGPLPKVVGSLLKKIAGKPVFKPETFESANRQRAVRCNHKSQQGLLFPLDKSCMWIHKPTVWIRYADIEAAEVQRYDGTGPSSARTWDLVIKCRSSGAEGPREYTFQSLDRSEKEPLISFFKTRGIKIIEDESARGRGKAPVNYAEMEGLADEDEEPADEDDDDSEDSDADLDASSESDDDSDDDEDSDGSDSDNGGKKRKSSSKKKKSSSKSGKDKKSKRKRSSKQKKKSGSKKGKKRRGGSSSSDDDDDDDGSSSGSD